MTMQVNLIAKIEALGTTLKGAKDTKMLTATLKEADGKSWDWSSFHLGIFKEYEVGDVIEIVPKLVFKEGNKWPFRNIESVVGKREASQMTILDVLAGQSDGVTQGSGSVLAVDQGNGQNKAFERRSIERQTSVKLMGEIYKAGCGIDDLQMIAEAIVKAAETVETWLARQGPLANVITPSAPTVIAGNTNGAASTNGAVAAGGKPSPDSYKMETIGDLFTAVKDRYKKAPSDIFDALNVQSKEELLVDTTIEKAWGMLQSIWEGPPEQPPSEN